MADVFISHSSKDHLIAEQLCEGLEANGISCWMAPRDITAGTEWALAINNAISASKVFLIVYSELSAQSKQVSKELGLAGARGIPMIPYKIDSTPLSGEFEYYLLTSHWIAADDATGDYKFGELLTAVKSLLGTEAASVPVQHSAPVAKPVAPTAQNIVHEPAKSVNASDKKKKLIPIIAAAVALVAVVGIVLAVVLSGGSGTGADGGSVVVSDDVSDDVGADGDTSQSESETPPAINSDVLRQVGVDITPSDSQDCRILADSFEESFSVGGVRYNTGVLLNAGSSHNTVTFDFGGAYEKMSLRAAVPDGAHHDGKFTVRVYFDDNEQEPIVITEYDLNKLYEYDVTGVNAVRLCCDHRALGPEIALTDFYVSSTKIGDAPSSFTSPFDEAADMLAVPDDLVPYDSYNCTLLADDYEQSFMVAGVKYNTGILLDQSYSANTVAINANGKFEKLSFRVGRVDGGNKDGDVTVRVYLDGKEAKPIILTEYDITMLCEYDITGVRQIRIKCDHRSFAPNMAFTDIYVCKSKDAEVPSSFTSPFDESVEMLSVPVDFEPYDIECCRWLSESYEESFKVASLEYNTGILLDQSHSANTMAFNVNGKFEKLSFRVGRVDGGNEDGDVTVRVYLDGSEAQPVKLTRFDMTKFCEYDITGARQVRIECDHRSFAPEIAFTDIYLCKSKDAVVPTSFISPFEEAVDMLYLPAELAPYDVGGYCSWLANSYDDSFTIEGVEYNTGLILSANSAATVGFNLNGVFKTLSFSVGQFDSDKTGDLKLRVYFDGNEAQPVLVTHDSMKYCEYDITGVKQIRFECDHVNFAPQVGVTGIVVSK